MGRTAGCACVSAMSSFWLFSSARHSWFGLVLAVAKRVKGDLPWVRIPPPPQGVGPGHRAVRQSRRLFGRSPRTAVVTFPDGGEEAL